MPGAVIDRAHGLREIRIEEGADRDADMGLQTGTLGIHGAAAGRAEAGRERVAAVGDARVGFALAGDLDLIAFAIGDRAEGRAGAALAGLAVAGGDEIGLAG